MSERYLTAEAKQRELERWHSYRHESVPADRVGGYGYPDPEIFEVCDRLNALPGVCTLQSCAGHELTDAHDGSKYVHAGQLWLWLDESTAAAFDQFAPELAASPSVERLRKLWLPEGREVVDVEFPGYWSGRFAEAIEVILDFFETAAVMAQAIRERGGPSWRYRDDARDAEFGGGSRRLPGALGERVSE